MQVLVPRRQQHLHRTAMDLQRKVRMGDHGVVLVRELRHEDIPALTCDNVLCLQAKAPRSKQSPHPFLWRTFSLPRYFLKGSDSRTTTSTPITIVLSPLCEPYNCYSHMAEGPSRGRVLLSVDSDNLLLVPVSAGGRRQKRKGSLNALSLTS